MPPWTDWRLPRPIIWAIQSVGEKYAQPSPFETLRDCPSVMDHDGVRRAPWGTYRGGAEDPAGVRLWLARLRYTPKNVLGATLASVIAERTALATGAVFQKIRDQAPILERIAKSSAAGRCEYDRLLSTPALTTADAECGERVAPVIGHGRLSVPNRYEDWLLTQGSYPWFSYRYESMHRASIPPGTELLAGVVELADAILVRFGLLQYADSQLDVLSDVTDLQHLMGLWRRVVIGRWESASFPSARAKLPQPYWLQQWESPNGR